MKTIKKKSSIMNSFLLRIVLILGILLILYIAVNNKPSSYTNILLSHNWQTYTNKKYKFSVDYPGNMYIDTTFSMDRDKGIDLKLINPTKKYIPTKDGKGKLTFEPGISVDFFDEITDYVSLDQIIDQNNISYNDVLMKHTKTDKYNKPAYVFEYNGPKNGKFISTLLVMNNRVYRVSSSSYEITQEWRNTYDKVVNSLTVLD